MTKKVYDRIEARFENNLVRVTVEHYSRGGLLSPTLEVIVYKDKKYSPKHNVKPNITIQGMFSVVYGDHVRSLIPNTDFIFLTKKDVGHSELLLCACCFKKRRTL